MPRKKGVDLILAVDFGGSSTKIFYAISTSEIASLVLEPEIAQIPKASLYAYEERKISSSTPENEAWVGFGDTYYAVGYLAASKFPGNARLNDVKCEVAAVKVMAAIWVITQKHKMNTKTPLRVALSALLPIGEYADRERFEAEVFSLAEGMETPSGELSIEILSFDCKPEGAGVYMSYRDVAGERIYQEQVVCIMLGYRNTSALISDRGRVSSDPIMSNLGMRLMLSRVMEFTSGLDPKRLLSAIVQSEGEGGREVLWKVCKSRNSETRNNEVAQLESAILGAKEEYLALLINWFREILPEGTDQVIFAGGTAQYLRSCLETSFLSTPLVFHGNIHVLEERDPFGYGSRLADVCGLFDSYFIQIVEEFDFQAPGKELVEIN